MLTMDYRMVDVLNADQLEEGDLIGIADSIVKIISITPTSEGFVLINEDEYGEQGTINRAYMDEVDRRFKKVSE